MPMDRTRTMALRNGMLPTSSFICLFIFVTMNGMPGHQKVHIAVSAASLERSIVNSAPNAGMFDFFHVMPEGNVEVMTEWDLLLTLDQYQTLYENETNSRVKRKAVSDVSTRWTNCYVYYEITEGLDTKTDRAIIKEAIDHWEKYTCLQFRDRPSKHRRIQFKDGGGCYSKLGMQDGPQPLVLAKGCRTKGIVAHEIGHAIGWIHEHMRPDRDEFIKINLQAIDSTQRNNYEKYTSSLINTYNISYDYTSLMHYGNSVIPGAIIATDKTYQDKLGQREGLSFKDIKLANVMYDCATMSCDDILDCKDGFQMSKVYNGQPKCQCWCDSGNIDSPLVLCKDRKKPPPTPKPSEKPVVMPKMMCIDVRSDPDCKSAKQNGYCMTKMDLMVKSCKKTCGFCKPEKSVCMDYDKGCRIMAATGACQRPGFHKVMSDLCKASCGLCPEPPNPCDVMKVMMGDDIPPNSDIPNSTSLIASKSMSSIYLVYLYMVTYFCSYVF